MSTFDAVRNRKRGEEAKQRVLDRTYSPKEEKQQESTFSSVRNRQADAPVTDPAKGTPMSELLKQTGILYKDPRNTELVQPFKQSTIPAVTPVQPKTVDFKDAQAAQKSTPLPSPFEGKTLAPINSTPNIIQSTLQGKLPAASLLQQTGRGPANASDIPGISEYEIRKKAIADTEGYDAVKPFSNAMNYLAFGNPIGLSVSNSFTGNSGVTRRDSTGNETVDKVTDAINNFITPLLVPSGAPIGTGPTQGSYDVVGKALSKGLGQKAVNGIAKVIPKASPAAAQNIARVGLTETLAGAPQGVGIGLLNQQDSNEDIQRNALYGLTGGAALGFGGAVLGEVGSKLLNRYLKRVPESNIEVLPPQQEEILALPEGRGTVRQSQASARSVLDSNVDPIINPTDWTPEPLGLPEANIDAPTTARKGKKDSLNTILEKMKTIVVERMTPPYENPNELAKWIQTQFKQAGDEISLNEVRSLGYEDMRQVAEEIRKRISVETTARQVAKELGYDYDSLLSPKKIDADLVNKAKKTQDTREAYGLGNKVKSTEDRYQTFVGEVAQPETVIAKPGAKPRASQENVRNPKELTREQQIQNKVNAGEYLPQEDIDYLLSGQYDKTKAFPEESPTVSTYEKPRPITEAPSKTVIETKETINSTKPEALTSSEVKPKVSKTEVQEVEEAIEAIKQSNVRDKVYSYLDDAEKAARERIAKRKGQLNSNPLPEWADYAVIMAAKLGKGTIKATNFTEELVKEFGESVRPHGDKILRMSREEIRKQERIASKEGVEAHQFNNTTIGDASSFAEKISRDVKVKKKPFSERWQQWRTQTSDDLAALSDVEKKVRGGKLASAEDSLYKSARMFKGAPERASQIVQDRLGTVIQQVEKAGNTVEDLEMFALAKHAQDVNAAGYKSGFTNQEIKSVLDELPSPEMIAAQQELVKVNREMLNELVDSGVVSKELYEVLGDRWKNYIPLFREMESEKVGFDGGMSKALANVTSPIKALQGSEKKVIAPLENMVKNIFQSVNAAERNKVAQQIPKLAELDTEGAFFRKLQNSEVVGEKNVVKVKVDGKEVRYEVEPEIYKALMNLDQESSNTLMNILSKPASLLRAGATLTPEFALRNPIRDINNAFVVSESGFNPITDFGVGLIQSIKKGDLYKEWIDNLGAYGNTLSMDRNVHKKALETVLKQPNSKKFVNFVTGKSLINVLRAISDTTESATKVGEYRAALRSGASKQEAAYRSRDLMDFARAGSSIRPANKIVAFLNANIQGKSKLIRAIKDNPGGVIARGFASVTMPTLAIFTLNHEYANETQKSTISNAPDWMKDSFWLMAIPGTDTVARIPKPFDLAAVFANLPEKAMAFTFEKDPEAFQGYVNRTLKDASLPTQISGLLPFLEGMANYSFFKEGQIIPRAEQGLEWSDQYDPVRTTSSARIIAGGVEKLTGGKGSFKNFSSPRVVDNTIQGLTAGVGKYATDAVDVILDKTGVFKRTAKPEKSIEQAPFTRSFLVDQNQGGKAMDKFYTMKDELTKEKASAKLNNRPFVKQGQLDSIGNIADALGDINKAIKRIEKGDFSSSQKKEKIDPLIKRRNEMIQRTMKYFKDQNKVIK